MSDSVWPYGLLHSQAHLSMGFSRHEYGSGLPWLPPEDLCDKGPYNKSYGFSSSHIWMWELDHKEDWALKSWCFWIVLLEKTLENPLDTKGIKTVNPEGNQLWIFIGRTDAEVLILWPPDVKSWLFGKDLDPGRDWRQEEKWVTEDETVGWHHWLNGHEFEQTQGDGEKQGSLAFCSPWGRKKSDTA